MPTDPHAANRRLPASLAGSLPADQLSLLDLIDRLLNRGVVVTGEAAISVAGIELIYLSLNLVLASTETLRGARDQGSVDWDSAAEQGNIEARERTSDDVTPVPPNSLPPMPLRAPSPARPLDLDPDHVESGLAKLVLTLVELIRQALERQAVRRMEGGGLSDAEVERLGLALQRLQEKLYEMAALFDLQPDDLNIDLGPLGSLL